MTRPLRALSPVQLATLHTGREMLLYHPLFDQASKGLQDMLRADFEETKAEVDARVAEERGA